jgi:hypothetical protein
LFGVLCVNNTIKFNELKGFMGVLMGVFLTTKQQALWSDKSDAYEISSPLLCALIGANNILDSGLHIRGFNAGKNGAGYILLTYIASQALNLSRYPFYQDRATNTPEFERESIQLINSVTDIQIQEAVDEFKLLYEHHQRVFDISGVEHVRLLRHITSSNYSQDIVKLVIAAKKLKYDSVVVDMDIINSFTDSESQYSGKSFNGIVFDINIPLKDVAYTSSLTRCNHSNKTNPVENSEWVVINRDPRGLFKISVDSIIFDESKVINQISSMNHNDAQNIYNKLSEAKFRFLPCRNLYQIHERTNFEEKEIPRNSLLKKVIDLIKR